MKITEHIDALQREGRLLAAAATQTELDAPIPTCPDWRMRDLVRHVGGVHRWATGYVGDRRTEVWDVDLDDIVGTWPADLDLIDWFREGHTRLVHTLASAPPDLDCFTFLAAPSPLAMWARRQAHETAMHRVDAESPGSTITKFHPTFAADGVDELLSCFITRPASRTKGQQAALNSCPRHRHRRRLVSRDQPRSRRIPHAVVALPTARSQPPPVSCTCYYGTVGAMRTSALTAIEISLHCGGKVSRSVGSSCV